MEYLTLNNGIRMPLIGFGTFMLGGGTCPEAVSAAIENGCRMIDTAEAYGNEKEVGKGIKQSGVAREELFLVTKVNFKSYENAAQAVRQSGSPWPLCRRTISICCFCTGRLPTTTRRGGFWRTCMRRAGSAPSAFPTSSRISSLI